MLIRKSGLTLRRFYLEDAEDFFHISNDDSVKEFVPGAYCESIEDALDLLEIYSKGDEIHDFYVAVVKDGILVGTIIACQELVDTALEVSAFLGKEYRNQGIMSQAMKLFIQHLRLNKEKIHKKEVQLLIKKSNIISRKSAEKLGVEKIKTSVNNEYDIFRIRL